MRHHRRADDAERQIQHVGIGDESVVGAKPRITSPQSGSAMAIWTMKQSAITPSSVMMNASIQRKPCLQPQDQEHVERGDEDADLERDAEDQIEPDGGADDFGEVGGADGELGQHPERPCQPARESIAAGLRQIPAGADGEARAQRLQDDRHDVAQQRDGQQRVAELGPPASEVAQLPGSM